jgi:FKBP-type peptidyl-prolyl cis-trans isomerase/linker histone H1 and H5 family
MAEKQTKSPKSVMDMIVLAIRSQPVKGNGISRPAITKYLQVELGYCNSGKIKQALKKGVDTGKLVQTGQSFRVHGDPIPERAPDPVVGVEDVELGRGTDCVNAGNVVVVSYEGKLSDGTIFDSASSFEFTLGIGEVIKGWDMGIIGMKVNGTRELKIPASLGYGKRGSPPEIPPNAELFFTVTLKKIK